MKANESAGNRDRENAYRELFGASRNPKQSVSIRGDEERNESAPRLGGSGGTQGSENVLGLQESVRLSRFLSGVRAGTPLSDSRALDSLPVANQGQGRAQPVLGAQGAI